MKRVGLCFILCLLFSSLLLAFPRPLSRLSGTKSNPLKLSAMAFSAAKLFVVDLSRSEVLIYDISTGQWQATGIKFSCKAKIVDIFVDEGKIYLLDAQSQAILIYDFQGKMLAEIRADGVKELNFKGAKSLLVNYQGFIYVLGSTQLYALSKEGMLMATTDIEKPVTMSLGEDQLIRVLQHSKSGSEVALYDLNLKRKSSTALPNSSRKANFIIDFAVNLWGEMHVINSAPLSIEKIAGNGKVIADTRFGSQSRGKTEGAFKVPVLLSSGAYESSSLIAIYDSKQEAIHIYQDTEPQVNELLRRPVYTVRPSLQESKYPLARDYLPSENYIYTINMLSLAKTKGKPAPVILCADRAGKVQYSIYLQKLKDKKIKDFSALAIARNKLYALDAVSSMVHVFNLEDGVYLKSFGGKGAAEGKLSSPQSIIAASDGNIFVADTENRRISIFNEHEIFVRTIPLLRSTQRPLLLRSDAEDLYCLSDDGVIMKTPLKGGKKMLRQVSEKGISSFDVLNEGRLALVELATQKLKIFRANVLESQYFTKSKSAVFPHFANVYLLRYDPHARRLVLMDSKAHATRYVHFYAALDQRQSIRMDLNDALQSVLSWQPSPGISNWIVQAHDGNTAISSSVSVPRFIVSSPQAALLSYQVCPVAGDGKRGVLSESVEDHFSQGRYLFGAGQYIAAVEAYQRAQKSIHDARIDKEIVQCYIAEADRFESQQEYERALVALKSATGIQGTSSRIALKAVNIFKTMHAYRAGIKYLEGVDFENEQSLLKQYIELNYLAQDYDAVVSKADLYGHVYGSDPMVLRYLASAYEERGDYREALSRYQEMIALTPDFDDELKVAKLQMLLKQYRAAEGDLQSILIRYPKSRLDMVQNLLGQCNVQSQNYGSASDHYNAAIQIKSDVAEYHNGLGTAYLLDGKPRDAQVSFRRAYELSPDNANYGLDYAKLLERENNFDDALRVMESVAASIVSNDTAVDFHVHYARLLRQSGNLTKALAEITKAKSYKPDDREINQVSADIKSELEVQNFNRPVIEIRDVKLQAILPSLNEYYRTHPIGTITLYNTRDTTINNVKLTVYVHEVGSRTQVFEIPALIPKQDKLVDIVMDFNERLFERARTVPVEIKLSFAYEGTEHNPSVASENLQILSNKAMDWKNKRSIASFVNPQDERLAYFVRQNIVQAFGSESTHIIDPNLIRALQVYSFYRAHGILFSHDSSVSNLAESQYDEVQFPHQLLQSKAGDCEDLLVLLAGTLESIGIQTAMIDVPSHVMLAVKTDLDASEISKKGLEAEYFIAYSGSYWFPLETTLMGKTDFVNSWLTALRKYQEVVDSGRMPEIITFAEAHRSYPPSSFSRPIDGSGYTNSTAAKSFYLQDLARISTMSQINREMSYRAALEKYPENISVRLQYALYSIEINQLDQAERLFKDVLSKAPDNFAANLNLGNIYSMRSELDLARAQYLMALEHSAGKEDAVYRNLCLLEYGDLKRSKAMQYFQKIKRKEIIREVDAEIYADLMRTGD